MDDKSLVYIRLLRERTSLVRNTESNNLSDDRNMRAGSLVSGDE